MSLCLGQGLLSYPVTFRLCCRVALTAGPMALSFFCFRMCRQGNNRILAHHILATVRQGRAICIPVDVAYSILRLFETIMVSTVETLRHADS